MTTWEEICDDPALQDLPYKMETDRHGRIILIPAKNIHGWLQAKIASQLQMLLPHGEVITECAIDTAEGTKVADVAWLTAEHFAVAKGAATCSQAPAICVEIKSAKNTWEELRNKGKLYFHKGAVEIWVCDEATMQFFDLSGEISQSRLVPNFPKTMAQP